MFVFVLLGAIGLGLAVFEALVRHTAPSDFMMALFYPAMLLPLARRGPGLALCMGVAVGLGAGLAARDGAAMLTYVVANAVQWIAAWFLFARWERAGSTFEVALCTRIAVVFVATALGAGLGVASLLVTELAGLGHSGHDLLVHLVLHWFMGDSVVAIVALFLLYLRELKRPLPNRLFLEHLSAAIRERTQ
ncbi:MAG: hypothetical protein AAFX79_03895 [Planctomycetota bacterium]